MPTCPYCTRELTTLYSSLRITLRWRNDSWNVDNQNGEEITTCPECHTELEPRVLDSLGVPVEMR